MKRTAVLRRTPLVTRTALTRGTTVLARQSARRKREAVTRRNIETRLGKTGATGTCAMCRTAGEVHGHELDGAGFGKDYAHPDCLLCNRCNGLVEDNPEWAARNGWKRSTKYDRDLSIPVGAARSFTGAYFWFPDGAA